jgi:hypothetical protein
MLAMIAARTLMAEMVRVSSFCCGKGEFSVAVAFGLCMKEERLAGKGCRRVRGKSRSLASFRMTDFD